MSVLARIRHSTVLAACVVCVSGGVGLIAYGVTIPVYTDQALASELKLAACTSGQSISAIYAALDALQTLRHPFMQAGFSVILIAVTVGALFVSFPAERGRGIQTPKLRSTYIWLGVIAVVIGTLAQLESAQIDIARGDWSACGPTAAMVLFGLLFLALLALVFVPLVGFALTRHFPELPVGLTVWDDTARLRSWIVTVIFGGLSLLAMAMIALQFRGSDFAQQPANVIFLYLFAATRAALLGSREGQA